MEDRDRNGKPVPTAGQPGTENQQVERAGPKGSPLAALRHRQGEKTAPRAKAPKASRVPAGPAKATAKAGEGPRDGVAKAGKPPWGEAAQPAASGAAGAPATGESPPTAAAAQPTAPEPPTAAPQTADRTLATPETEAAAQLAGAPARPAALEAPAVPEEDTAPKAAAPPNAPLPQKSDRLTRLQQQTRQGIFITLLFCAGLLLASVLYVAGMRLQARQGQMVRGLPALHLAEALPAEEGLSTTEIVAKAAPSVVSIELYQEGALVPGGSGSGVVLSANGYIATNAHVVHRAETIRVVTAGGRGYRATLVGLDLRCDLAVLKIDARGLTPAEFAASDGVVVGQKVLAIGNVAGTLPGSPSQGIISGVERQMPLATADGETVRLSLLQTDAAINPGSSGGALVDACGRVIGISIGKIEEDGVENIGFAIPSSLAVPVLQTIVENGFVKETGRLGVVVVALNETTGPAVGLPAQGLYLAQVQEDSTLFGQGIRPGDVIVRANGRVMEETGDLYAQIIAHEVGEALELVILKEGSGKTVTVRATLLPPAAAADEETDSSA